MFRTMEGQICAVNELINLFENMGKQHDAEKRMLSIRKRRPNKRLEKRANTWTPKLSKHKPNNNNNNNIVRHLSDRIGSGEDHADVKAMIDEDESVVVDMRQRKSIERTRQQAMKLLEAYNDEVLQDFRIEDVEGSEFANMIMSESAPIDDYINNNNERANNGKHPINANKYGVGLLDQIGFNDDNERANSMLGDGLCENRGGGDGGDIAATAAAASLAAESDNNAWSSSYGGSPIYENVPYPLCVAERERDNTLYYKSSTIYDVYKNPRITDIVKISMNDDAPKQRAVTKDHKEYITDELINTEEAYVKNLEFVVMNYKKFFVNLTPLSNGIFSNIEEIFNETKIFLDEIKDCHYDYQQIGETFLKHTNLLNRYPIYCRNKKASATLINENFKHFVAERELELDDRLGLSSHLLKPVQRLGKYELLLKNLNKRLTKEDKPTETIRKALDLIISITRKGNDMITIDSIQNLAYSVHDVGDLILKNEFKMTSPKKLDVVLFLFTKRIIIATKDPKDIDKYIYFNSVSLENLGRTNYENEFKICHFSRSKKINEFKFVEVKQAIREKWIEEIDRLLWQQLVRIKAEANALHNDEPLSPNLQPELRQFSPNKFRNSSFFINEEED